MTIRALRRVGSCVEIFIALLAGRRWSWINDSLVDVLGQAVDGLDDLVGFESGRPSSSRSASSRSIGALRAG